MPRPESAPKDILIYFLTYQGPAPAATSLLSKPTMVGGAMVMYNTEALALMIQNLYPRGPECPWHLGSEPAHNSRNDPLLRERLPRVLSALRDGYGADAIDDLVLEGVSEKGHRNRPATAQEMAIFHEAYAAALAAPARSLETKATAASTR